MVVLQSVMHLTHPVDDLSVAAYGTVVRLVAYWLLPVGLATRRLVACSLVSFQSSIRVPQLVAQGFDILLEFPNLQLVQLLLLLQPQLVLLSQRLHFELVFFFGKAVVRRWVLWLL